MLKSIKVKNLRAIEELEVKDFSQVNLFVGQNCSGKTTLLEALFFLCGATNPELPIKTNAMRGFQYISDDLWSTYFRNMDLSNTIEIEVSNINHIEHRLNIVPHFKKQFELESESGNILSTSSGSILHRNHVSSQSIDGLEFLYSCSNEPDKLHSSKIFREGDKLKMEGEKETPPVKAIFIGHSGEMDWKAQFGLVQRKKQVGEVISLLKEIDSRIEGIVLNEIGLLELDLGLPQFIPANLMGGGISKSLSIALAMLSFQTVLIDEIENGLHHSSQRKIWKAILSWAQKLNVQVFSTTHSWEAIKAFHEASGENLFAADKSKLFRIERENGKCNCVEFTQKDLETSIANQWEIR